MSEEALPSTMELLRLPPEELASALLPSDDGNAVLIGRAWVAGKPNMPAGPSPIVVRDRQVYDASVVAPTAAELISMSEAASRLRRSDLPVIGHLGDIAANSFRERHNPAHPHLLAPCDLQPVKACGVTYIASVLERLVEEKSGGNPANLDGARRELDALVGGSLKRIRPGSTEAANLKQALIASGHWSHYLEVAIGPDAESFAKCPPMAAVGFGADIGVRSDSRWNNPEPELVLAIDKCGRIAGVTLGNDVNLRDFEGRSPMLLDKAKDNNASAAIGPFIRLFDERFTLADARGVRLQFSIESADGYTLGGVGEVADITRDLTDLIEQVMGRHHQYPDGLMLFTGTMWVPQHDRLGAGQGFGHRDGDWVSIQANRLGRLINRTRRTEDCPPWTFGLGELMHNLSVRGLLSRT